ncbi:MAG: hypothetical protein TU35_001060 [Thermoproteus sp. AZ2]|uniref:Uncharacterized protein n=1 Tax=Thermoproteus sp. AZ2 TaxID=1609232 RepID=A0ACC6UYU4_9CREN
MSFLELLKKLAERRRLYVENLHRFLQLIKETVRRYDPTARVLLFGSYAEGGRGPTAI